MAPLRLGIFASHGGSNLQAIIDAANAERLNAIPCVVISNNGDSLALTRARNEGISAYHLSARTHLEQDSLDKAILQALLTHAVDIVVLAGYLKKLGPQMLHHFSGRILNIHPALLPKYGGQGMYGRHVHEAVLAAGEQTTGVTIHLVTEDYDSGPGWVETPKDEWQRRVIALAEGDRWIIDGNYGGTLHLRLAKADMVLFLDYPWCLCLWRVLKRQLIYRGRSRPDLTPGCIERVQWDFLKWICVDFPRRSRLRILQLLEEHGQHAQIIKLQSPGDTRRLLGKLVQGNAEGSSVV